MKDQPEVRLDGIQVSVRKIIHIDMDCFYAAVEMRDRPELKGKPVAVGGSPEGRGVVATASYEARKFGVRSAMASATARRLCPQLITVRPDFSKYKAESLKVREIFNRYSNVIEPLSLDEAYLDVTGSDRFGGSATRIAEAIRADIKSETGGLTASAGVAPNKFLAKVASELNKPDGLAVIRPEQIEAFMKTLPIEKIWGVGKVTAVKMRARGIFTCGDLQKYSVAELTAMYGSWGVSLHDYARGKDERPMRTSRERKSLSVEETYSRDLETLEECFGKLPELFEDWNERAVRAGIAFRIRGLFAKVKFKDFSRTTHECVFEGYPEVQDFRPLLEAAWKRKSEPVRLLGIGVRLAAEKKESSRLQLKFEV